MAEHDLEVLYGQAQSAIKTKDYKRATGLLKQILVIDENYRDASRLLARLVHEKRRRWYNDVRIWGPAGGLVLLGLLIWIVPKLPRAAVIAPTLTKAASPTKTATLTLIPSPTPTLVPLAWKRISIGQEFERDRITAIVVDPKDPDVIYVGTQNAGIYKSIDGGLSWTPALDGLGRGFVDTLVIDPNNSNTLYAGLPIAGAYKSIDGGNHWESINAGIDLPTWYWVGVVVIDKLNSEHLYYTGGQGIYESFNGGKRWTRNFGDWTFWDLVMHPLNTDMLFAARDQPNGLFKSVNRGKSWRRIDIAQKDSSGEIGRNLWIDSVSGDILFVSIGEFIYASKDGGESWTQIRPRCMAIAFYPKDSQSAFCVTDQGGVLKTSDAGQKWQQLTNVNQETISAFLLSPHDVNTLMLGGSGLSVSVNGGVSFVQRNNGLGTTRLELSFHPIDKSKLYLHQIFVEKWKTYISSDNGRTWDLIIAEGSGFSFNASGEKIFRSRQWPCWTMRSSDGGKTWNNIPTPGDCADAILGNPGKADTLFALYSDHRNPIFISLDSGKSWSPTNGMHACGYPRMFFGSDGSKIYSLNDCEVIFSADGGHTWGSCGDSGGNISRSESIMAIDPRDSNHIFLGTLGGGIRVSENGCKLWGYKNTGLGNRYVNSISIDPNAPDTIYAGTDGGAYVSFDSGATWNQINDGLLGATVVYSIVVDKDSNVYAATPYGIFKLESK